MDIKGAMKAANGCLEQAAGIIGVAIYHYKRFLNEMPDELKVCDRAKDATKSLDTLQAVFEKIEDVINTIDNIER